MQSACFFNLSTKNRANLIADLRLLSFFALFLLKKEIN